MDTTRAITYRGFTLNEADGDVIVTGGGATGAGVTGCKVDSFDLSDVDVVQWTEKRSQADGNDAGDVQLGGRRIRLSGTLYATTRKLLHDTLWELRAALNPVLAQREEPLDKGYRPFYFSVPTNRTDVGEYPDGVIALQMKALPRAFQQVTHDDEQGGEDTDALAIPWQATLLCKDPAILSADPVEVAFTATASVSSGVTSVAATDIITKAAHGFSAGNRVTFSSLTGGLGLVTGTTYYVIATNLTSSTFMLSATLAGATVNHTTDITAATYIKSSTASGTWVNRGNYLGKLNMLVEVGAGAGSISAQVGDSVFVITVPASTVNRIIRLKGEDRIVTFEEASVETVQVGAIDFTGDTSYPLIDPEDTPYTVTFHGMSGVVTGSLMWFYEQYA